MSLWKQSNKKNQSFLLDEKFDEQGQKKGVFAKSDQIYKFDEKVTAAPP
jgi:hypothetical protein